VRTGLEVNFVLPRVSIDCQFDRVDHDDHIDWGRESYQGKKYECIYEADRALSDLRGLMGSCV
jgi:hypothetical protein